MKKQIRSFFLKMTSLILLSAGLAFVANSYGPRRISWVKDWDNQVEQLANLDHIAVVPFFDVEKAFAEKSARFVDARSPAAFSKGHIPGAINVPLGDSEAQLNVLDEPLPLIVYCDGPDCDDALNLCRELKANGIDPLSLFAGGMEMWSRFERSVETGADQ